MAVTNYRRVPITVNANTGLIVDAVSFKPLIDPKDYVAILYGETVILCLTFVDDEGNPYAFNSNDTFELAFDSNFDHTDDLMAYSDNTQVNISGDWASASITGGKISIRLNCLTVAFGTRIGTSISLTSYFQVNRYISGSIYPSTILFNVGTAKNVVKTTEGEPAPSTPEYYSGVQVDALLTNKRNNNGTTYPARGTLNSADILLVNESTTYDLKKVTISELTAMITSGYVTGPVSSVTSNFASYTDTTGKNIGDSGYSASSFAAASGTADIEITNSASGLILTDRTTSTRYRLLIDNGIWGIEPVA